MPAPLWVTSSVGAARRNLVSRGTRCLPPFASSIVMPVPHSKQVYLVAQGGSSEPGLEEVSPSWRRSANTHGVDPDGTEAPRILTSGEVKELRGPLDKLIFNAQEEIDRLYKVVREA